MSIELQRVTGAWVCSTIHCDRLVIKTYMGYTKAEAKRDFQQYLKEMKG